MEDEGINVSRDLAYLSHEDDIAAYLDDMILMQAYAMINRELILNRLSGIPVDEMNITESIHNYYNSYDNIIRKGAISAREREPVLIPLNMKDGIIIGEGKGIPEWNWSAPHGAGRTMSRKKAKQNLDLQEYKDQMKGVWSSCVNQSTLDEAPGAYKNKEDILGAVKESVTIWDIACPVYNFKA